MIKPINHYFSGCDETHYGLHSKKWYCTLVYHTDTKCLGIAVVGKRDQFCRKTGAAIALGRAANPDKNVGKYAYRVASDEELKSILIKFRVVKFRSNLNFLIRYYFPEFQLRKPNTSERKLQQGAVG